MHKTLAGMLGPMNRAEIARKMTAAGVPTLRNKVHRWAQDEASPDAREIVALAGVLDRSVDELTAVVAADIARRAHGGPRSVAV